MSRIGYWNGGALSVTDECYLTTARSQYVLSRSSTLEKHMAKFFVEPRPKGRPEGSAITDYVVEREGDVVLKTTQTQAEAITWAKINGHTPHVARVRHLNDKKKPDQWRPV